MVGGRPGTTPSIVSIKQREGFLNGYQCTSAHLWYTVGPASASHHADLLNAGATGARLTFSYGTDEFQADRARALARESIQVGLTCLILADLPGNKVRLGTSLAPNSVNLAQGEPIRLIVADSAHPRQGLPVPLAAFVDELKEGNRIVIGDGAAELEVRGTRRAARTAWRWSAASSNNAAG